MRRDSGRHAGEKLLQGPPVSLRSRPEARVRIQTCQLESRSDARRRVCCHPTRFRGAGEVRSASENECGGLMGQVREFNAVIAWLV